MVIFKEFTSGNIDRSMFDFPEEEALAYEIKLSRFRRLFGVGEKGCQPGSSSHALNWKLAKKLDGEKYDREVYNRLIEVLRNPIFVEKPEAAADEGG
jgi:hypothetical protein